MKQTILKDLILRNESKLILLVMDGLGGLPDERTGKTELETARTPNIDSIAEKGILGFADPVGPGITPGSGPGHLALFGYEPLDYEIGRGVLEALGLGVELTPLDVACRANFATMDGDGIITDRRAGRISSEKNKELCGVLKKEIKEIEGVQIIIESGKEHRFVVLFRGEKLSGNLCDTDPQKEGKRAFAVLPKDESEEAVKTAGIANEFIKRTNEILKDKEPANTVTLRGFAKHPEIPLMQDIYGLKCAAIATYPMYRGLARLVGMKILETGENISDEVETLISHYSEYDFFFLHIKKTDSYGEDGNFEGKVKVIEEVDFYFPKILALNPDVIVITGDHSTPSKLKSHSWHPVPFLLYSENCRAEGARKFSERECAKSGLGRFPLKDGMQLMLAHSMRLAKFGA